MKVRIFLIGLLVVCGIGVSGIGTAAAQPAGPPAGYKIEEKYTKTSPDGAITIEQYVKRKICCKNDSINESARSSAAPCSIAV